MQQMWLRQLQLEFEEACNYYGVDLQVPIFEITNSKNEYGAWCAATGTLRLSRHLIENYSWSITLQVLKHEMAHQLCGGLQENRTPHDEAFQMACETLGVLPEFRHAGGCLSELVEAAAAGSSATEIGRRCIERVKKLLALSESSNEHEAALAMQKANDLIEKHHIQSLCKGDEQKFSYSIIDRKRKRIERYQRQICTILKDFFFVKVVLSRQYDPERNQTYRTIELLGKRENVAIAEYCYHFLEKRLVLLWSSNRGRFKGSTRIEKNSYYLGLLNGFYQKLKEQRRGRAKTVSEPQLAAMVVTEKQRLDEYVALRFPRLRKIASKGARLYRNTYNEGVKAGKTISLAEGLTPGGQGGRKLLR
ncbi:MAG: SprT-like domain-containing protein [Desulforhopalus sp.]